MKSIIAIVVLIVCAISLFTVKNYALGAVFIALTVLVFLWSRKKKTGKQEAQTKPASAPAAPASAAPQPSPYEQRKARAGVISFKIAGVTFEDRQEILKKIDVMEDDDYISCTYGIALTEYEGKPAFRVYVQLSDADLTEKTLGFVPKDYVNKVLPVYDAVFGVEVEVYGGYDDKSYGAAATLYYDK